MLKIKTFPLLNVLMWMVFPISTFLLSEAPKPQRQPRPDRRSNRQGDYLIYKTCI